MIRQGMSEQQANKQIWLVDRQGLILDNHQALTQKQQLFSRHYDEVVDWQQNDGFVSFAETIRQVKPTVLIGCSAVTGAFNQDIVESICQHCDHPVILPLSNPTERSEATPQDLINWSHGKARIATGSPFPPVKYQQHVIDIAQCNNALAFPGIGLGIVISQAKQLSSGMLWAALNALVDFQTQRKKPHMMLLPSMTQAPDVAKAIAIAVAKQAIEEKLSKLSENTDLDDLLAKHYWDPHYVKYYKS